MRIFLENAFMISYVIVVILSIIKYAKYFDTPLKYLPIIFFYTLLTELLGGIILVNEEWRFFGDDLLHYYNMVIYNIYAIVFFVYFYYIYWVYIVNKTYKKIIVAGALLFVLVSLINPFFQSFLFSSQTYAYVLGSLVLLLSILFYLMDKTRLEIHLPWKYNLLMWLSAGIFIFYASYLPIEIYRHHNILKGGSEPVFVRSIVRALILLMNLLFSLGFVFMRNKPIRPVN